MRSLFPNASACLFRSCFLAALSGAGVADVAIAQEGEPPRARLERGIGFGTALADHAAHGLAPGVAPPDLCPMGDVCYDLDIGYVKHRDIGQDEVTGQQTVGFTIQAPPLQFMIGEIEQDFIGSSGLSLVGAAPYDPATIHRLLPLGQAQQWSLTSFGGGHPFHIHINPFRITSVRVYQPPTGCFQRRVEGNPTQTEPIDADNRPGCNADPTDISTWVDVSAPGSLIASGPLEPDGTGGLPAEPARRTRAWKDTVFTPQGQLVQFRTRYERYIGDFVLHCHILDHEDQGMMQNVRIALTDGKGGFDIPMTEGHSH